MNISITPTLDGAWPFLIKVFCGELKIAAMFQCDAPLFSRIVSEAQEVVREGKGQAVDADHPTTKYVGAQDPLWKPLPGSLGQWSLYNSQNDFSFSEDDHSWSNVSRRFNSRLSAIPEFFACYFQDCELQNCRLNAIEAKGTIGLHREKVIGIGGRLYTPKLRFHLPIQTNPDVRFVMDNKEFVMEEGKVYVFNQSALHGVRNDGGQLRIHLIFDCYLTPPLIRRLEKAI